ncbi:MAG: M20 family metallopeptidase [Candidatus Promineifilaceae bacterium]
MDWERHFDACLDFARRLIQTPSMPGEEAAVAALVMSELSKLGFDEVWLDAAGNVNGRIKGGEPSLAALVFNAHLDHVDPGPAELWPYPPFSAKVADRRLWGRGACDIKGPLAVQVYGMAAVLNQGHRPRRDLVFSAVVQEETGGLGAIRWAEALDYPVELIVIAEPSSNRLSLGHRGIIQLWVTFQGRSAHASVPENADNPNYALAKFLTRLAERQGELSSHPHLGPSSVAPTILEVDTTSANVTPAFARVLLDFRSASESPASLCRFLRAAAGGHEPEIADAWGMGADILSSEEPLFGYFTPPEHPVVARTRNLLGGALGGRPELIHYRFATDGRHFAAKGINVVGFSPGEEALAHTVQESISLAMMRDALRATYTLARGY